MYEFIKKVKRFEVKWPENCTAEWVGKILNPGEVRADWWNRDEAEARW